MLRKLVVVLITSWLIAACAIVPQTTDTPATNEPVPGEETPLVPPSGGSLDGGQVGGIRSPLDALPDEERMTRGVVMLDSTEVQILESDPVQVRLHMIGSMPTPCHHLRANLNMPEGQKRIEIELYSLSDPNEMCVQVIQPFESNLDLGSFLDGEYEVFVNGEKVANFSVK